MATKRLTEEQKEANKLERAAKAAAEKTNANETSGAVLGNEGIKESKTESVPEDPKGQTSPEAIKAATATTGGGKIEGKSHNEVEQNPEHLKATGAYSRLHGVMPDPALTLDQINDANQERRAAIEGYENAFGYQPGVTLSTNDMLAEAMFAEGVKKEYKELHGSEATGLSIEAMEEANAIRDEISATYSTLFASPLPFDLSNEEATKAMEEKKIADQKEQSEADRSVEIREKAAQEQKAIELANAELLAEKQRKEDQEKEHAQQIEEQRAQAAKDWETEEERKAAEAKALADLKTDTAAGAEEASRIQKENEEKFFEQQRLDNEKAKAESEQRRKDEEQRIADLQEEKLKADLESGLYVMAEKVNAFGETEKKKFSKVTWDLLKHSRDGWKETVQIPKEVQALKNNQ